jgi:trafficking protein particle complex subunit 9
MPDPDSAMVFVMDLDVLPHDSVVYEGVLNDIPIGRLEPREERTHAIGVCFLSRGHFELSAQVRPFGVPHLETRMSKATLIAIVK